MDDQADGELARGIRQKARSVATALSKTFLVGVGLGLVLLCWYQWGGQVLPPLPGTRENGETATKTPVTAMRLRIDDVSRDGGNSGGGGGSAGGVAPRIELRKSSLFREAVALKSEKIVYCPIQKVASTEWLKVFRWVDGQEDWEKPKHTKLGLDVLKKMNLKRSNDILNSPAWLKFAIVREPAERLLSCFFQKCNQYGFKNEYPNCPYMTLWPKLFESDRFPDGVPRWPNEKTLGIIVDEFKSRGREHMFVEYVEAIVRRVKKNACDENGHWSPQYCHCSLDVTAPLYHVVGWDNMTEAAEAAIVPISSTPQRGREIAEFLNARMKSNHENNGKKTGAGNAVEQAYSESMLQAVHEAFAKDYELFSRYWE